MNGEQFNSRATVISKIVNEFITAHQLPESFHAVATSWYLPLADEIATEIRKGKLWLLGINGCQGSGKSTLSGFLTNILQGAYGLNVVSLSLDDFYLTRFEREQLAARVHPLLQTRGVPGTHDVQLAIATIQALKRKGEVQIPRFDKSTDDRKDEESWDKVTAPVDLVILEGWCLATPAERPKDLLVPINQLEAEEDPKRLWRDYVNQQLADYYQPWFAMIEKLILLKAPNFDAVYRWRGTQEDKLRKSIKDDEPTRVMNMEELNRFIQHYERLTHHSLNSIPAFADIVFELNDDQQIESRKNKRANENR